VDAISAKTSTAKSAYADPAAEPGTDHATPKTATTAPTSERVIWEQAGTDENDCC